jgi:hypothetical protein
MDCFLRYWVPILGVLISAGTLVVIIAYTRITARLERAAQEQAEALQKPVLALICVTRLNETDQLFEQAEMGISPQAMEFASDPNTGKVIIKNIGTGPALNVTFVLHPASLAPNPRDPHSHHRRLPYLGPKDTIAGPTTIDGMMLDTYKFTVDYESLSGKKYHTKMLVSGGLLRENWTFKRS